MASPTGSSPRVFGSNMWAAYASAGATGVPLTASAAIVQFTAASARPYSGWDGNALTLAARALADVTFPHRSPACGETASA